MDPDGRGRTLKTARTTPVERSHGPPQSLIISPNLDALLEYEERMRGPTSQLPAGSPGSSKDSEQPPPHILYSPTGLPPPPRRRRKPQSPTTPQSTKNSPFPNVTVSLPGTPILAGPLEPNPYINSPPSFGKILETGDSELAGADLAESGTAAKATGPTRDNPADGRKRRRDEHQRSRSSGDETPESRPPTDSQPSPTNSSPKARVDKFFNIKNTFGLFSDTPSQKVELNDVSNAPLTSRSRLSSDRSRIKGKLSKFASGDTDRPNSMQQVIEETVLDIRRQDSDSASTWTSPDTVQSVESVEIAFRQRRPSLSHEFLPSSSRSSWDSLSSDTTDGPVSTIEPRISISSTIYPAHSSHSHSRSMYQSADGHPVIQTHISTSPVHRSSSDGDRISSIEFLSLERTATLYPFQSKSQPPTRSSSPKPPIPTLPKPTFDRSSPKTTPRLRQHEPDLPLPPTTNFLELDERLELIRRRQKLARVFGQSPGPDVTSSSAIKKHLRGTLSMSTNLEIGAGHENSLSTRPAAAGLGRRHSTPMSPDDFSIMTTAGESSFTGVDDRSTRSNVIYQRASDNKTSASPTSFIDLSDDLGSAPIDNVTKVVISVPSSPSVLSLFENMSPEERVEEERRRKRQKLVKLHRFLGSRVPTGLVLGLDNDRASLPPDNTDNALQDSEEVPRKLWARRRRSSSAAVFPSTWSDGLDRLKEDLNDKEKAINVRRAQKMEKVFGVAPPQTLYHTRRSPSPSVGAGAVSSYKVPGWPTPTAVGESHNPVFGQRNLNRTSYMKPKAKPNDRPGTSESNKQLLPKGRNSGDLDGSPTHTDNRKPSNVYCHFQHSLNSLNDIIDRDDKEGLAELHEYLNHGDTAISPHLQEFSRASDRRLSSASSIKSERRRSLPTNTSVISLISDYGVSPSRPEVMDFQARRRRATKLTQFFGVDYRELINDVLESIENGLEHERKRGALNADEAEELLARLRNLRIKREGLF